MLLHSLELGGGFGEPKVGRHAFARDWDGEWKFDTEQLAFSTHVEYEDGSATEFYRRERPQLLFSEDEEIVPLFLTTGVQGAGSLMSYSVVQPIGDEAVEFEKRSS